MKNIRTILFLGFLITTILIPLLGEANATEKLRSAGFMHGKGAQGEKIVIPLRKTKAQLEISGSLMSVKVNQEFRNKNRFPIEAVYVFPIPSTATVTDYVIIYKDKVIKSVVKEKKEAKFEYEKAKSEGKRAALLEEERPNIFTTSVANIMPGETVHVEVTFLAPLEYHHSRYEILFPTVVGPRYIPVRYGINKQGMLVAKTSVKDFNRITPPLIPEGIDPKYELDIEVSIDGIPFKSIYSPTHKIKMKKMGEKKASVHLTKKAIPDSDFVLKIDLEQGVKPFLSSVQHTEGKKSYGLIDIFPPLEKESSLKLSREVLFLVDTSGSMQGMSIKEAKEGLKECLYNLREGDFFNIIRFSNDYSAMHPQTVPATKENLGEALYYVEQLQANGGTEMQPALDYLLSLPRVPNTIRMVVFLTDGAVGNETSLMRLLKTKLNGARVFPFGIGSAPNEYLLRRMSQLGHGAVHFIHESEEIGKVISEFFKTIDSPVLTDVEVQWLDPSGQPAKNVRLFPKQIPDLYQDRPLSLYYESPRQGVGSIRVKGKINGKRVHYLFDLPSAGEKYEGIKILFGRAEVDELLYQYNFGSHSDQENVKKKVIQKGIQYQLVTPFTSRVAVEKKIIRREGDRLITAKVPTLLPKGWTYEGLVGTATSDVLYFLIGFLLILLGSASIYLTVWRRVRDENNYFGS